MDGNESQKGLPLAVRSNLGAEQSDASEGS